MARAERVRLLYRLSVPKWGRGPVASTRRISSVRESYDEGVARFSSPLSSHDDVRRSVQALKGLKRFGIKDLRGGI